MTTIRFQGEKHIIHSHETFGEFLERSSLHKVKFINSHYGGVNLEQTFGEFHKQWPNTHHEFFRECYNCFEHLEDSASRCPGCRKFFHKECYIKEHYREQKCSNCKVNDLGCCSSGSVCGNCRTPFCGTCRQNGHKCCDVCCIDTYGAFTPRYEITNKVHLCTFEAKYFTHKTFVQLWRSFRCHNERALRICEPTPVQREFWKKDGGTVSDLSKNKLYDLLELHFLKLMNHTEPYVSILLTFGENNWFNVFFESCSKNDYHFTINASEDLPRKESYTYNLFYINLKEKEKDSNSQPQTESGKSGNNGKNKRKRPLNSEEVEEPSLKQKKTLTNETKL